MAAQRSVLHGILARNASCAYGRQFGFAAIDDIEAYQRRVPRVCYEDIAAPIAQMAQGAPGVLTADPIVAFEETGGSTGGAKLIPYTARGLADFQAGLLPWLDALSATAPQAMAGRAYWSISPACRAPRQTPAGLPIGMPSDAAYFGDSVAPQIAASLAVPPQVAAVEDVVAWRRLTLIFLVACEDLTLISVWSPTFLLDLLDALRSDADVIGRAVASGVAPDGVPVMCGMPLPAANPARSRLLMHVLAGHPIEWHRLWPRLALISCWDEAQSRPYTDRLRRELPAVTVQGKGLLATEGLVSIPIDAVHQPVLALSSGFYEFVDRSGVARTAIEVDAGEEYDLLLTTSSGLYRYAIGDRVRVTGFIERTPTLAFVGRSGVYCDLCGEKLGESFVAAATGSLEVEFRLLVPDERVRGYVLILDAGEVDDDEALRAARHVDERLARNPQYAYARRLGQLAAVRAHRVHRPLAAWIEHGRARGQRLGEIKLAALYPRADWADFLCNDR